MLAAHTKAGATGLLPMARGGDGRCTHRMTHRLAPTTQTGKFTLLAAKPQKIMSRLL